MKLKLQSDDTDAREFRCRRCNSVLAVYSRCSEVDVEFDKPTAEDMLKGDVVFVQQIKCRHCGEISSMMVRVFGEEARAPRAVDHPTVFKIAAQ